mmetsp:Transcript_18210/g.45957  ORF Transcript_18210/g.45957 Transcript_18210/m.45957 type:complete len:651 (-) Transcript_18210:1778-3730(-)
MEVHVDGLLGLLGVDKLALCLLESPLVLEKHGVLEVNLWELALHRRARELEGLVKRAALRGVVNGLLDEPKLVEQLRPGLAPEGHCPRVGHLLGGVDAAVRLGHADGVVPVVVRAVHVDGRLPVLRLHVVPLRLLELVLALELLRQVQVRLREEVLAVLRHEPDHVVIVPVLLVHVDGEVGLRHHQVELLRLLDPPRGLELLRLRHVELPHLVLGHVGRGDLVRLVPLVVPAVHLDGALGLPRPQPVPLRLVKVLGVLKVLRNHLVEALRHVLLLRVDNLHRLGPLLGLDRRLDRLDVLARLDKVVDGRVQLLLLHQVHAPVVLERHHLAGELPAGEVDSPAVGVAPPVGLEGPLGDVELLEEGPRLLVQPRAGELRGNHLQHLGGLRVVLRQRRGARGQRPLEVEADGRLDVPLLLLELRGLLLLLGLEQPLKVLCLHVLRLGAVLALRDGNGLVPPVKLLVHLHGLLDLALLEQDLLGPVKVLLQGRHLGLDHEVLRAVLEAVALRLVRHRVDFAEEHGARRVPEGCAAPLRDGQPAVLQRQAAESVPHRLRLGRELELLEQRHGALVLLVVDRGAKLNQRLVQAVGDGVDALIDDDLGAATRPLNVLNIALDLKDGDPLRRVNRVPNTQVVPVLRNNDVRGRDPLDV